MNRIYRELKSNKNKIILNIGGACSGKSYNTAKFLADLLIKNNSLQMAVIRKDKTMHKLTTKFLLNNFLKDTELVNKIKFVSPKELSKNTKFDFIWGEEATEFNKKEFTKMLKELKTNGILILTCNPVDSKYIKSLYNDDKVTVIKSNYKDNKGVYKEFIKSIEDLKCADKELYTIYCLGEFYNE